MVLWPALIACLLLLIGVALRARVRLFQWLFVPGAIIGGLVGLVGIQIGIRVDSVAAGAESIADALRSWPGLLIAIVFAGLLLERPEGDSKGIAPPRNVLRAGLMVWIIVLGQVVIGLVVAGTVAVRFWGVSPAIGQLIEAGFAGGHGTSTALGAIHAEAFPEFFDLAMFVATFGLVYSVVSGIVFVNIGVRRGWVRRQVDSRSLTTGLEARGGKTPLGMARITSDVLDPLALQGAILGAAVLVGVGLQWGFTAVVELADLGESARYLGKLPLFLFTLLGGWIVRSAMGLLGVDDLIDGGTIRRLVGISMEFLIVGAIASLRIEVIADFLGPLLLLCVFGCAWAGVCLVPLSKRILPRENWFELGLINYGMSTGTTAQGLMLLRIVDRDLESGAAETYALAAPLSAPFIGGGVVTMSLPLLLDRFGLWPVVGVLGLGLVVLLVTGLRLGSGSNAE